MSASDVSPFHLVPRVSPNPLTLAAGFWCVVCVWFLFVVSPLFFCKWQSSFTSFFIYTALGDRQCFHARSARR